MRVLHVIPSVAPVHGGPSSDLRVLTAALAAEGMEVHVVTTNDDGKRRLDVALGVPIDDGGVSFHYFALQTRFYSASLPLARWLWNCAGDYDVIHIHALFSFASVVGALAARRANVPYVVKPHGVLNQWGRANRRHLLKKLSFRLIEGPLLDRAGAIQWTTAMERDEAADLGLRAPAVVIPNAMPPLAPVGEGQPLPGAWSLGDGPIVLFLSRINVIKGIDVLIDAFALAGTDFPDARLVIAGEGPAGLVGTLEQRARDAGVADRVIWAGHASGAVKENLFGRATVFVQPSRSESFGVAVVEAMARGTAVVVTDGVGIHPDVAAAGAGLVVGANATAMAAAIRTYLGDDAARAEAGRRGRALVESRYASRTVARRLRACYETAIANAGSPRALRNVR